MHTLQDSLNSINHSEQQQFNSIGSSNSQTPILFSTTTQKEQQHFLSNSNTNDLNARLQQISAVAQQQSRHFATMGILGGEGGNINCGSSSNLFNFMQVCFMRAYLKI